MRGFEARLIKRGGVFVFEYYSWGSRQWIPLLSGRSSSRRETAIAGLKIIPATTINGVPVERFFDDLKRSEHPIQEWKEAV